MSEYLFYGGIKIIENTLTIKSCPLCDSNKITYSFVINGNLICECKDCSHLFINQQPLNGSFFNENDFSLIEFEKIIKAKIELNNTQKYNILEIGSSILGDDNLNITNIKYTEINLFLQNIKENKKYDFCILNNILDHSYDPCLFLRKIHGCLKKNSLLLFYIPVLDSKNAKKLKLKWSIFNGKRLHFFNKATIQNILCKCGYEQIRLIPADDNGVFISCKTGVLRDEKLISIIIPVYNEGKTVETLLNNVVNKQLDGIKKEIIIVESNSKDSTRQIVENFVKWHPEVKLILEEKPQGKGHAVRNGFKEATGDFIAIQDGDLEYDINDYDQLVEPLVHYQKPFVLGSRHTGDWKMRDFRDDKFKSTYMNLGHIFFTGLINIGCKVKLKDPFTMYKLFRRECLYDLEFDGNRFEIDWEIVIKLIRKGYIPEEIPINYNSRGYKEGKKVSLMIDPFRWIISFIRYRWFYKIGEK